METHNLDESQQSRLKETSLPMFDVQKVELQFSVSADFVAAQVSNNVLVLALHTNRIMRIDLNNPADIDDVDLPKKVAETGVIRRLFLDPTASHLIISTALGDNYYLHTQSHQPKPLSRLKGILIESISWNPSQPTASTREILLGATDGLIYETFLELSHEFYRREEKYIKAVYRTDGPVSGIWTDILERPDNRRILIATRGKLIHFVGRLGRHGNEGSGSVYSKIFDSEQPTYYEPAVAQNAALSLLAITPEGADISKDEQFDRIFSWLNPNGLFLGNLLTEPPTSELGDHLFRESRTMSMNRVLRSRGIGQSTASLSTLTQWHALLLVDDRIVAVNRLDDSIVYDQAHLDRGQRPLALLADLKKNTFWFFTSRDIFEIIAQDEDRNIWKILLKAQKFEEALQYANNPVQKDAIATAFGDHLFREGRYSEAASTYGTSSKAFEEVALDFIDKGQKDALRQYLLAKLAALPKSSSMQRVMLTSWLIELYMAKLNSIDDMIATNAELEEDKTPDEARKQFTKVQQEYREFTRRYKDDLDRKTVYGIISGHGREEELLFFSTAINDYNYVLSYWVQRENWAEALKALTKQTSPEIIYKYSSVLMANIPVAFIDILMRQTNLDPQNLIPALLNYNNITNIPLYQNQAVRYLLFEINQRSSTNALVHNTLISIYASDPSRDETSLLTYLESQSPVSIVTNQEDVLKNLAYDADFALRLCIKHKRIRSCVHVYTTMGQYASAVDLALRHREADLAIAIAERPEHDVASRKKLWLSVARSVIAATYKSAKVDGESDKEVPGQQSASISSALALLRRAPDGVLRIDDLLPLFPDFIRVDAFRDEICAALESCSAHVDSLRNDMDASAAAAARIKRDVSELGRRWVLLEPGDACALCGDVLLDRRFWVWHCSHGAHTDCLANKVAVSGAKGPARRVRELRASLEQHGLEGKKRESAIRELDEILGAECPLCGDMAIRGLDEPFSTATDSKEDWSL